MPRPARYATVSQHGDRPAVIARSPTPSSHETALSYYELDLLSNRLASSLLSLGVTKGDRVAVSLGNGAEFAARAVEAGAAAVISDRKLNLTVPTIVAKDPRRAYALAAATFWGAQPETCVAVTGTNGKTSVANFCRQMFAGAGRTSDRTSSRASRRRKERMRTRSAPARCWPASISCPRSSGRFCSSWASKTCPTRRLRGCSTSPSER